MNGNQAGTVDRVQLHGGLDHGRGTHHTDALRPSDIALARCRLGFRPAHEDVELTCIPIDSADVISGLRDAAIKVAERIAFLGNFAVHIFGIEMVHDRQRRIVRHECIGSARFHRIRASTMLHIVGKRLDLAIRKLDLNLLQLIQLTACFINRHRDVRGHRCRGGASARIDNGNDVVLGHVDFRSAVKTGAVQIGSVVDVVLCVHRIGILPLGDLKIWFHQIRFGLIRVRSGEGITLDIVDIVPDGRILLDLGGRNPAQELIARHGHVGIGRRGFEGQGALIRSLLTIFWLFGHFNRLINMRVVIRERRIRPVHLGLQQVTLIAPRGSPHDIIALVVEINVRGNHRANVVLLICTHHALDGIFHICPIFTIALKRPEIQAIAIIHRFDRYVQRSRSPSIA